jgi:hypothetical protein
MKKKVKKKKLRIAKLEKKVVPSPATGKKPAIPAPYAPGTRYGLTRRVNLER